MLPLQYALVIFFTIFSVIQLNDSKPPPVPRPINRVNVSDIGLIEEDISKFMVQYRRMHNKTSDAAMRLLVTLGLVSGALRVEDAMKANLNYIANEMFVNFNQTTPSDNMQKLLRIEEVIERDRSSIHILDSVLAFVRNAKSFAEFKKDMTRIMKENDESMQKIRNKRKKMVTEAVTTDKTKSAQTGQLMQRSAKSIKHEMSEKLNDVKYMIDMHLNEIHGSVSDGAKRTIAFVQMMQEKHELNANSTLVKINGKKSTIKMNSALKSLAKIWKEMKPKHSHPEVSVSFEFSDETSNENEAKSTLVPKIVGVHSKIDQIRRQDIIVQRPSKKSDDDDDENEIDGDGDKNSKQTDGDDDDKKEDGQTSGSESESSSQESEGGLVGLIANLSGGDEGSDVGALIGALTQVITNLLGPNGIDVPSVIGSTASVLASLLAGDQNFGLVLGNYVGIALDGVSGGGGAANNGQFLGQFVGKLVSALSADPEDEDLPLQPGLFIENLFDGISRGAAKKVDAAEGEQMTADTGGSDSGSFISHIVSTIVAGIASGLAHASLGSSGGSSNGSAGLFHGSAHGSSSQSHKKS